MDCRFCSHDCRDRSWAIRPPEPVPGEPTAKDQAALGIAVTLAPFQALSTEDDIKFFSAGLDGEVRSKLASFAELRLHDIANTVDSEYTLKGAVRRNTAGYHVFVHLMRLSDGLQLWSQTYQSEGDDEISTQSLVAGEISRSLQAHLGIGTGKGRASRGDIPPAAYEAYLRGISAWSGRDIPGNRRKAIVSFRIATEEAPKFADAWARYGASITLSLPEFADLSLEASNRTAEEALTRAISLEPENVEAHIGLATYYLRRRLDIRLSDTHARQAIKLQPDSPSAHYALAMTLLVEGRYGEAHHALDRAIALGPDNNVPRFHKLVSLAGADDLDAAKDIITACGRCPPTDLFGLHRGPAGRLSG